jgi:hypothetical protein
MCSSKEDSTNGLLLHSNIQKNKYENYHSN